MKHCPSATRLRFHEPHRHKDKDHIRRMTIFPPCNSASGKRVIRLVNTPLRTMRLHSNNIAILSAACSSDSTRSRTTNVQACHGRALKMHRHKQPCTQLPGGESRTSLNRWIRITPHTIDSKSRAKAKPKQDPIRSHGTPRADHRRNTGCWCSNLDRVSQCWI